MDIYSRLSEKLAQQAVQRIYTDRPIPRHTNEGVARRGHI